jgi:hypothetical protein
MENIDNQKNNNASVDTPSVNDIDKQIFIEKPIGKITIGKLLVICSFINIGILFILFLFSSLVCLHVFGLEGF